MFSQDKIEAIYDLRQAVETKVRREIAVDERPTREARDALLDATLEVEAQTQRAIDVCHSCGHEHAPGAAHGNGRPEGKVIPVDFEQRERME